ncbi:MAG TPA: molybdopterin cofactor-binding domain-containing protein [Gaiellaceae bacterium]
MTGPEYAADLRFYLNGQSVTLTDVSPRTLLVDYLRSAEVGLTGTKIGCKQGGCGACTVLLSTYDPASWKVTHRSINSCLRPLASLDGAMVTTVEGLGSVEGAVSPVQYCLAKNNGTQCGYCTPGWVASAHGLMAGRGIDALKLDTSTDRVDPSDPEFARLPTMQEIQDHFDGNLCRCTGYRPILFGFEKGFGRDWTEADGAGCMTCDVDDAERCSVSSTIAPSFPDALKVPPRAVRYESGGYTWTRALTLDELTKLVNRSPDENDRKLVFGNTSIGVYDTYTEDPHHLIDISHIPELKATDVGPDGMTVGSALTYAVLLDLLDLRIEEAKQTAPERLAGLESLRYMAGRTAGAIVRDAASLGGNTMLVLRHIASGTPFPSDLFTALATLRSRVRVLDAGTGGVNEHELLEFAELYASKPEVRDRSVLLAYVIPFTKRGAFAQTYKTALREVNAHSIANAGCHVELDAERRVTGATFVLGGVAPVAVRLGGFADAVVGKAWDWSLHNAGREALVKAIEALFAQYKDRLRDVPWEGFTDDYKLSLAVSYWLKFFVEVALAVDPAIVSPDAASAAAREERPVSRGTQHYNTYADEFPINQPFVKLEAFVQSTGEAVYPQDIELPSRALEAAYVFSTRAKANFTYRVPGHAGAAGPDDVLACLQGRFPGVVDYLTCLDMPSGRNLQGMAMDQPVFAPMDGAPFVGSVTNDGQSIGLVLADDEQIALDAAQFVSTALVEYDDEPPLVTIADAVQAGSFFLDDPPTASWMNHVWKLVRASSDLSWFTQQGPSVVLDGIPCRLVTGQQDVGGQIHFYMETQTCVAVPGEEGQMTLWSSTQSADVVQDAVAGVLGVPMNKVEVCIKRIGGGYGGKCNPPAFVAIAAAVAARAHGRPVRLAARREVDTAMFGHRHPAQGRFAVAIGTGEDTAENKGKLIGLHNDVLLNGGSSYDCSFIVSDCLQLRADSAYFVPNYDTSGDVCRTNIASNTAFRTLGMIQGALLQEEAIESAAHQVGMLPEDVRARNLYAKGQSTPAGQTLDDCDLEQVFSYTRKTYEFDARLAAIDDFNAANRYRKRGISLIPVKYGSGYNLPMLEQAGALVEIFGQDGTVLVRTGGVEMGQGLNTKVAQAASYYLGIPLALIRVAPLDTSIVPNPVSTGASTGSPFNAEAVQACCEDLMTRLRDYCRIKDLRFPVRPNRNWDPGDPTNSSWTTAVGNAHRDRVNLCAQARVPIDGGETLDSPTALQFHPGVKNPEQNYEFTGFTYSAAIAEVEIDALTGETTVLRADVVYGMGRSQNPAIDVGQVEGGFIQGVGYVTSEEMVYQPDGPRRGALNSTNTWTYKPPAAMSIPLEMNVDLFPDPENDADPLLSSKEVGEPPMTLAVTVFFAIKHAILAARKDQGEDGWFDLEAPATVQRVAAACKVTPR